MDAVQLKLDARLADYVQQLGQPLEKAVPELIVLELYRRGHLSSGKAAELLGMERIGFIRYASRLGLPYFDMTESEWEAEVKGMSDL